MNDLMNDTDLTTPMHDIIIDWSLKYIENIIKELFITSDNIKILGCEIPLFTGRSYIKGYADILVQYDSYFDFKKFSTKKILFEIKSKIKSKGELLRQLQTYKVCYFDYNGESGLGIHEFCVISPDKYAKDILELHNFRFLEYDDEKYLSKEEIEKKREDDF
jgi:hypothetical protein